MCCHPLSLLLIVHPGGPQNQPGRKNVFKKTTKKIAKLELLLSLSLSLSLSLPLTHGEHVVIEGIWNALTKLFEEDHFRLITKMLMLMITLQQIRPN